ncbi:GNAT family N-acetyltransferase [Methylobacter psychrophilus]|uniref:GNAT family N-acetyltransferase n=1 Tax=Methylobacter psychrophilus TaxID=96941 RepID=UPI0021D49DB5|nr:GNAT family N-acetyltransferase [Methylobacter psychrophilus]
MDSRQSKAEHTIIPQLRELLQSERQTAYYLVLSDQEIDAYLRKIYYLAEIASLTEAGGIKGFIAFYCNDPAKDSAFITMLIVNSSCCRQGIGYALVSLALSIMRTRLFRVCRLQVHQDNIAAIKLYEGCGFIFIKGNTIEDNTEYRLMECVL